MSANTNSKTRTAMVATTSACLLVIAVIATLCEGENGISLQDILASQDDENFKMTICSEIRAPRMICAMSVGALLSIAGLIMQCLFRNPIVEPFTMGVSGGAVAGVATAFACGAVAACGSTAITFGASLGALATMAAVLTLRHFVGHETTTTLLAGVMISFMASAATIVLLSVGTQENAAQVTAWTMGSFGGATKETATAIAILAVATTAVAAFGGNLLNVMSLGESEATALGVDTNKATLGLFIVAGLLAAACVATSGVIAFVGMAVPQVAQWASQSDARKSLPLAGLIGATCMATFDLVAKKIFFPTEIPVGAVTALTGGIAFLIIIVRWKKKTQRQ